jgi:hypothetical protein
MARLRAIFDSILESFEIYFDYAFDRIISTIILMALEFKSKFDVRQHVIISSY